METLTQWFNSHVSLVTIRLVCPTEILIVPQYSYAQNSSATLPVTASLHTPACATSQPSCANSSSSFCAFCAAEPPGIRDHFEISRLDSGNMSLANDSSEWALQLVKPLNRQCYYTDGLINISIKCALFDKRKVI